MTLDELFAPVRPDESGRTGASRPEWIVLVAAGSPGGATRGPSLRRALLQLGAGGLVVIALVVLVGGLISRRIAQSQSVHEVARITDVLATSVIQPALSDRMATNTSAAARLDPLVRERVLSASLVRVKIWAPSGRIMYSDDHRLVGADFGLDTDARAALTQPQVRAEISDLSEPENRFERGQGTLLEVYRPVWTPSGRPLLFETYFRYDQVSDRASQLWRGFAAITLSSIAAVVVLLVPLVWALVARARRAHRQREAMLQRAMDASLAERRRIAATLHDGVVQELAAASFTVAGGAQDAAANGDDELAVRLRAAGDAVRTSIGGMRSLLVDIYPPNLRSAGLLPALCDLAATVRLRVELDVDDEVAQELPQEQQEAVFRVTQECLRNAAAHSSADLVTVRIARDDGGVELHIVDDGVGFDADGTRPEGHFGLSLIADIARECGAELAVSTEPGRGTAWRLRMSR
jgi:two-component system NarL family sensor kinase